MNVKEIKKEIKRLRRIVKDLKAKKLLLPSGSKERIETHREMIEVRNQLKELKELKEKIIIEINKPNPKKEELIQEILRLKPKILVNLNKFTEQELQNHIEYIKRKGIKNV